MNMLFTTMNDNNLCFKSWVHIVQPHPTPKCFQVREKHLNWFSMLYIPV